MLSCELLDVAVQVLLAEMDIRSTKSALETGPETLDPVRVGHHANEGGDTPLFCGMADDRMIAQSFIAPMFVRKDWHSFAPRVIHKLL